MRQFVFAIFMLLLFGIMAMVFVFIATVVVRGGFSVAYAFLTNGVPVLFAAMRADPWYVPALIIGALLVWSYPWEHQAGEVGHVRRGRQVTSRRPAYQSSPRRAAASAPPRPQSRANASRRHTWKSAVRTKVGRTNSTTRKWN